jgi:transcription initiation factor TFIIIB Brf1 subunit/transcription initiation factor TFIIB
MRKVLVCPVCKSTDIALDAGGYTGKYICKDCGYVGIAIEMTEGEYEQIKESEEISKKVIKEKSHDIDEEEHKP